MDPNNHFAAAIYGIIIILVSVSNVAQYATLDRNGAIKTYLRNMSIDLGIKVVGLIIAVLCYPISMPIFVFVAVIFLFIKSSLSKNNQLND